MTSLGIGDYKTPRVVACPACGYKADYGTCFNFEGKARPVKPGDISMCADCMVYLVYTDDLQLRLLKDGEWLQMPILQREYLISARRIVAGAKARREALRD